MNAGRWLFIYISFISVNPYPEGLDTGIIIVICNFILKI